MYLLTMSLLLLFSACWLGLTTAWSAPPIDLEQAELHFEGFIQQYGRKYADENEKQARFQIFKDNLKKANDMNENSNSAVYGITKFSDLTLQEFLRYHAGLIIPSNLENNKTFIDQDIHYADAPESFDWRDLNAVTPVKNQGVCGSCYAFSAIANIESQYAIKYKQHIYLSEQQIVDCDDMDHACNGGYPWSVFHSLIKEGGSMSGEDYPYININNVKPHKCKFIASKVKVKLADSHSFNLKSQEKVKQLLHQNGPLSICINADPLLGYHGGIVNDADIGEEINHAVLLVGYGTEADSGQQYWIVKNSWGGTWGEKGYFRMPRGEGALSCKMMNHCMSTAFVA